MKTVTKRICISILVFLTSFSVYGAAPNGVPQTKHTLPHIPGQLLVQYKSGFSKSFVNGRAKVWGAKVHQDFPALNMNLLQFDLSTDLKKQMDMLETDPSVASVNYNYRLRKEIAPNDTFFTSRQWAMNNTANNVRPGINSGGFVGADMNMIAAWDIQRFAPNVTIAVIDDAVLTTHQDLAGNVLSTGRCFGATPSYCSGGASNVNPTEDDQGHGTWVSGAAGAMGNNGTGVAGAAWSVNILPLKNDLANSSLIGAIDEAVGQGADIINMSLGGPIEFGVASMTAARNAGVLIVTSAGNSDSNNDLSRAHFPSNTALPNVLSVAASNAFDQLTSFSQWGPFTTDIAAPGQFIFTTEQGGSYGSVAGTSFAAPYIAGIAALIKENTGASGPDAWKQLKAHLFYGGVNGVGLGASGEPGDSKEAIPGRVVTGRIDGERALLGPPGGVLVINNVTVDDSQSGNNNGVLDPNETANLVVTLENVWTGENNVTGTLRVLDSSSFPSQLDSGNLTVNSANASFGNIAQDGFASASFNVSLGDINGNEQYFFTLELSTAAGPQPPRYFYHEVGQLVNGVTKNQRFFRSTWDEFQTFSFDVPVGATNLTVQTSSNNAIDIDLLLRRNDRPEYLIALAQDPEDPDASPLFFAGPSTLVSGNLDGEESITPAGELGGTWFATVVNFDQTSHVYSITASFDAPEDADGDGIGDAQDNCPNTANANQLDTDNDGQGNACDSDDDNDGVGDSQDAFPLDASESVDTDADGVGNNADTDDDGDGMPDTFETANGFDPLDPADATQDADGDGLVNVDEFIEGTDPGDPDSDNDSLQDGQDNCPADSNGDQADADGDNTGDACDNTFNVFDLKSVPDMDGDSLQETASLFVLDTGAIRVDISDTSNGARRGTLNYLSTGDWKAHSVVSVADIDGAGTHGIGVVATRFSDDLPIVQIKNPANGALIRNIFPLSASWDLLEVGVVPGAGNNGGPAIATLASRKSDGLMVVQLRNALDNGFIRNIFPLGLTWSAQSMVIMPDVSGQGPAVGVLARRNSDGLTAVQVRLTADGSLIRNVFPLGLGWSAVEVKLTPDLNNNGAPEVAVRMTRDSDGLEIIQMRDASTNDLVRNHYPIGAGGGDWRTVSFEALDNNGSPALGILSVRQSDGQMLVQIRGAGNSAILNNTFFIGPPWEPLAYDVLPDANGTGVSELGIVTRNPVTGLELLQLRDATSAILLNNFVLVQ